MIKTDIRKEYLVKRRKLSPEYVHKNSELIQNKIYNSKWYKNANVIMIYVSFGNEVETHDIINCALKSGKRVIVSVCTDGNTLIPVEITSLNDMIPNKYGILEPSVIKKYTGNIDVVLVPGIAFDGAFNRVGFGCGYYDRFLSEYPDTLKIGLGFSDQICDEIETDDNDIPMDIIVTDEEIMIKND